MFRTIFIILLFTKPALAGLSMGTSLVYTKINDPKYKYSNEYEQLTKLNSINLGYTKEYKRFNISLYSNRLFNKPIKRKVTYNNNTFTNETKTVYDAVQIGYRKGRLMPAFFMANTKIKKSLFLGNVELGEEINNIIAYGLSVNYFLEKNIPISLTYIFPNKEVHMEGGLGVGINYLF
jgi:hypothetical protein